MQPGRDSIERRVRRRGGVGVGRMKRPGGRGVILGRILRISSPRNNIKRRVRKSLRRERAAAHLSKPEREIFDSLDRHPHLNASYGLGRFTD